MKNVHQQLTEWKELCLRRRPSPGEVTAALMMTTMIIMTMKENGKNERTTSFGNQGVNGLATAEQTQAATFATTNPNNTFQLKGLFFSLSD